MITVQTTHNGTSIMVDISNAAIISYVEYFVRPYCYYHYLKKGVHEFAVTTKQWRKVRKQLRSHNIEYKWLRPA